MKRSGRRRLVSWVGAGAIALGLASAPAAARAAGAGEPPPATAPAGPAARPVPPPAPPSADRLTRPSSLPVAPLGAPFVPVRRGPKLKTILIGSAVGALVVGVVSAAVVAASRPSQIPRETNTEPPNGPGWRL